MAVEVKNLSCQAAIPKARHVDGDLFIHLTSLFVIKISLLSNMLRVATLQKLAQDISTNVDENVV